MKNLLISVVLITALSFVFLACGGDDPEEPLSVYLSSDTGWTDSVLKANIPAGYEVTYTWYLNDVELTSESGDSISQPKAGTYKVVVATADGESDTDSRLIGPSELKGTWYLNANNAANREISNTNTSIDFNETLTISLNGYITVESKATGTPAGSGTAGGYTFAISTWSEEVRGTSAGQVNPTVSGNYFPTYFTQSFNKVWKVTGEFKDKSGDYDSITPGTPNANFVGVAFYIFLDTSTASNHQLVRTSPTTAGAATPNYSIFPRLLERTKANARWE